MEQLAQLRAEGFAQNHQPGNLHAAAGRPGAGADDHQQHQNTPAELGPQIKIRGAEARGGNDGRDGEKSVVERVKRRGEHPQNVKGNNQRAPGDDGKIRPHLGIPPCHGIFFHQQEKVNVEVHAEQRHEHGDHALKVVAVIVAHGAVLDAEAAGAGGAEGGTQAVKQGHSPKEQQHHLHRRHDDVNAVKNGGGFAHIGHHLAHGGTGAFRPEQVVGLAAHIHQRQHEHQNAHAPQPVGEAAPEEHPVVQRLHIGQDAGAGGGKAGNRLKHGV